MRKYFLQTTFILGSMVLFSACRKEDTIAVQPYTVPATYDFQNVDYNEATARINMWSGFTSYLSKATTRQLSQDTINYLWSNTNSAFTPEIVVNLPNTNATLNSS